MFKESLTLRNIYAYTTSSKFNCILNHYSVYLISIQRYLCVYLKFLQQSLDGHRRRCRDEHSMDL